jgi:hypothetical protein
MSQSTTAEVETMSIHGADSEASIIMVQSTATQKGHTRAFLVEVTALEEEHVAGYYF